MGHSLAVATLRDAACGRSSGCEWCGSSDNSSVRRKPSSRDCARLEAELAGEAVSIRRTGMVLGREGSSRRRRVVAVDLEDRVQDRTHRVPGAGADVDREIGTIGSEGRQHAFDEVVDIDEITDVLP